MTTATMQKELERASKIMGVSKKRIVNRALWLYLKNIKQQLDLYREFDAWEKMSDEALLNFEKKLGHEKG